MCQDVVDTMLEQRESPSASVGEDVAANDNGLMRIGTSGTASSGLYIAVIKDEFDDRLLGEI